MVDPAPSVAVAPPLATQPKTSSSIQKQGKPAPLFLPLKSTQRSLPVLDNGASASPEQAKREPVASQSVRPPSEELSKALGPKSPVLRLFQTPWVRRPKSTGSKPSSPALAPAAVKEASSPKRQSLPTNGNATKLPDKPAEKGVPIPLVDLSPTDVSGLKDVRAVTEALMTRKGSAPNIACAYCTATGVTAAWRRDKAGRPLCGKCCDQLRRRMNPRYAASGTNPPARNSVRGIERFEGLGPPRPRPNASPYPTRQPSFQPSLAPIRQATPPTKPLLREYPPPSRHDMPSMISRMSPEHSRHGMDLVSLPPISDLERIAGSYAPYYTRHSTTYGERRRSEANRIDGRPLITEEDIRQSRQALLEGRKWILSVLEETNDLLKALDETRPYRERPRY